MKVIFYIGHHKVGSTALQAFLGRNWARLARAGILYPSTEGRGYAYNLGQLMNKPRPKHLPPHLREPHNALAYQMIADVIRRPIPKQFGQLPSTVVMLEMIRQQTEALAPHTVVICAEAFANFGEVDPGLVSRLCTIFPGADFAIYCALRRPDDYLASWHGQRLKVGEPARPLRPSGLHHYLKTIHFDYPTVISAWLERVPAPDLILRNYADILKAGGSMEDFVERCDLTLPDNLEPPGRANPSLPLAAFSIMEQANQVLDPLPRHHLSMFLQQNAPKICPIANRDVEVFGAAQREQIVTRFRPHDSYLAELIGQSHFFEDLNRISETRPVSYQQAARQLLDAIDPDIIPHPIPRDFIRALKNSFVS